MALTGMTGSFTLGHNDALAAIKTQLEQDAQARAAAAGTAAPSMIALPSVTCAVLGR